MRAIEPDARRRRGGAEQAPAVHPEQAETLAAAAARRRRLLAQEVEEKPGGGCQIKSGTAKGRVVSVPDPEMRHGRKRASQRFQGHQAAVDRESPLMGAVEVLAGNAGDAEKGLEWGQPTERVREAEGEETVGEGAYGGGPTRRAFADAKRVLTAQVPFHTNGDRFPQREWVID